MESSSLELLHSAQLNLLIEFDRLCKNNKLTYFLDSGTALGAVRHGGFIPWDDDVDVAMPRKDYDLLLEIGKKGLPNNLFLQTFETDPAYMMPFAKIRQGNTYFPEKGRGYEKLKYQGLYIDVFPYDRVPENPRKAKRRIRQSRIWYYVSVFSRRDYPGKKRPLILFTRFLHSLPDGIVKRFRLFYERFCTKYNSRSSNVLTCYCWRISQRSTYLFKESELLPTKTILFEGKELCIMRNPHVYLTKMFGDYNTLPPVEERKTHLAGPFRV